MGNSRYFSSCGGNLGVSLELQQETQGSSRVAVGETGLILRCEGEVGIPLEVGESALILRWCGEHGVLLDLLREIQGSSLVVVTCICRNLSSCKKKSILLSRWEQEHGIALESLQRNPPSSRDEVWNTGFFSSCCDNLGVPLKLWWVSRGTSCVEKMDSSLLSTCEGDLRITLELLQGNQASSGGEGRIWWFFLSCSVKLGVPLELQQIP